MSELLEKDQVISVVPQDFKYSNKGKVTGIQDRTFTMELHHAPEGIEIKKLMEFYSQTKNGMLYFSSSAMEINGNVLTLAIPRKHRFLQRRAFTRIKFIYDMDLIAGGKTYKIKSRDVSASGMKMVTSEHLDIDSEYDVSINLLDEHYVKCKFEPIKIEKNDDGSYTISGRFKDLSNTDKTKLIQFCMRKNVENMNK